MTGCERRPRFAQRIVRLALAGAMGVAAAGPVAAQTRPWEVVLKSQLLEQEQCTLAFLTQVEERPVDGVTVIEARAHCDDGRAFDVRRDKPHQAFTIVACPNVC